MAAIDATDDAPLADVLLRFGTDAAALLLSPSNTAMTRTVSGESVRSPEVGRLFHANGPDRLIRRFAGYLALARVVVSSARPIPDSRRPSSWL